MMVFTAWNRKTWLGSTCETKDSVGSTVKGTPKQTAAYTKLLQALHFIISSGSSFCNTVTYIFFFLNYLFVVYRTSVNQERIVCWNRSCRLTKILKASCCPNCRFLHFTLSQVTKLHHWGAFFSEHETFMHWDYLVLHAYQSMQFRSVVYLLTGMMSTKFHFLTLLDSQANLPPFSSLRNLTPDFNYTWNVLVSI